MHAAEPRLDEEEEEEPPPPPQPHRDGYRYDVYGIVSHVALFFYVVGVSRDLLSIILC